MHVSLVLVLCDKYTYICMHKHIYLHI